MIKVYTVFNFDENYCTFAVDTVKVLEFAESLDEVEEWLRGVTPYILGKGMGEDLNLYGMSTCVENTASDFLLRGEHGIVLIDAEYTNCFDIEEVPTDLTELPEPPKPTYL
jgi:hypothetical protein